MKYKRKPKVKLLTWWSARQITFDHYFDDGIWQVMSVDEEKERIYTLLCILNRDKSKLGKQVRMAEWMIVEWGYLLKN